MLATVALGVGLGLFAEERLIDVQFVAGTQETLAVQILPSRPGDEMDLPASHLDPASGLKKRFHPRFGLVLVEPDGPLLAATRDTIAFGTEVTALFLDGTSRARVLRVIQRTEASDAVRATAPFLSGPGEPRYFRLEWIRPAEAVVGRGLGIIDAKSKPRGGPWRMRVDIDDDGRREAVWSCDEDGYLRIKVREPRSGYIVWSALCKAGTSSPPICKPDRH
jgi:hypothetical protein